MNRDAVSTMAVAVCCLLAIGATATTMESAVETTPDDAIDVGYDSIPLDGDTGDRLKEQIAPGEPGQERQVAVREPGAGEPTQTRRPGGDASGGGSSDSGQLGGGADDSGSGAGTTPGGTGEEPGGPGSDLLSTLMDVLFAVLAVLVLLVALVVAVRHRDRLADALRTLLEKLGLVHRDDAPTGATGERPLPPPNPQNDVAKAWYVMVQRLGITDSPSMTPRECVKAAREADIDPDPVERLTRLFEQVRYGGASVDDRRRDRSRRALRQVLNQLPGGDAR